jgi:hypothetical protein
MDDVRELWDVVWQWLLWAWQWLLALPWGAWFDTTRTTVGAVIAALGGGMVAVRGFLGSADGWDILGNVATVLATIWLMSLGREFVAQSRLTILSGLYAHMEELHRIIMSMKDNKQKMPADYDALSAARKKMKNYFHDNRFMFSKDLAVLKALETAVSEYGDQIDDYKKTNTQYQRLRTMLEEMIHQRNVLERFFHFLFIGVWVSIWRWLWRPRGTRSVK